MVYRTSKDLDNQNLAAVFLSNLARTATWGWSKELAWNSTFKTRILIFNHPRAAPDFPSVIINDCTPKKDFLSGMSVGTQVHSGVSLSGICIGTQALAIDSFSWMHNGTRTHSKDSLSDMSIGTRVHSKVSFSGMYIGTQAFAIDSLSWMSIGTHTHSKDSLSGMSIGTRGSL